MVKFIIRIVFSDDKSNFREFFTIIDDSRSIRPEMVAVKIDDEVVILVLNLLLYVLADFFIGAPVRNPFLLHFGLNVYGYDLRFNPIDVKLGL